MRKSERKSIMASKLSFAGGGQEMLVDTRRPFTDAPARD
jgi:hypothetical protein